MSDIYLLLSFTHGTIGLLHWCWCKLFSFLTFSISCTHIPSPHTVQKIHVFSTSKVLTPWTSATSSHNCSFLSALSRCQDGSGSGSGNAPLDQKFLLKWSVPLSFVEVLEFGSSEDMADNSRYPAPHSGEKVVINAKPSMNHSVTFCRFESAVCLFVCASVSLPLYTEDKRSGRKGDRVQLAELIRECQAVKDWSLYRPCGFETLGYEPITAVQVTVYALCLVNEMLRGN